MDETDFRHHGPGYDLSCYNAEGEFEGLPAEQIMHVATHSGTGATVHVITSAKSDINSIPDLAGTKFGVTAGMMAGYLDDVLWAYDMTTDDLGSVVNLSLSDLCTALQDGQYRRLPVRHSRPRHQLYRPGHVLWHQGRRHRPGGR